MTILNEGYLCSWERWSKVHEPEYCGHPYRPTEFQLCMRELDKMNAELDKRREKINEPF